MRWAVAVAAALLGALLVPGLSRASKTFSVSITADGLEPVTITVDTGDSVSWFNKDDKAHYIQGEGPEFDTGQIYPQEGSVEISFPNPGTFRYEDAQDRLATKYHGYVFVRAPAGPPPAQATTTTRPASTSTTTAPPSSTSTSTSTTTTSTTTTTTAPPPVRPRISPGTDGEGQVPAASEAWRNVVGTYKPRPGAPAAERPQVAAPSDGAVSPGSEEAVPALPKRSNTGLLVGALLVLLVTGFAVSRAGRSVVERARGR